MPKFISKSELNAQKSDKKNTHYVGEIYPQIFSIDNGLEFKERMPMEAGIIWLGGYMLDSGLFSKEKCPICKKEEVLVPYKVVGSILSGCHTIKFWCKNCNERFITNDHIDYFREVYNFILAHKKKFKPHQKLNNCTSIQTNSKIITKIYN